MVRHLVIDGEQKVLKVEGSGSGYRFQMDGIEREASLVEAEPGVYSIVMNGRSFEARLLRERNLLVVYIDGRRIEVEVVDPRDSRRAGAAGGMEGRQTLTAPMPGKVVRILVAEGDTVTAGQGLVVLEAMKMQNEMKALKPGRVVSLPFATGATVGAGDILAVVE